MQRLTRNSVSEERSPWRLQLRKYRRRESRGEGKGRPQPGLLGLRVGATRVLCPQGVTVSGPR